MALIRPRLTDIHGLALTQSAVDFAIPFLDEDLPLYVDPFLLWRSPSLQEQSLHGAVTAAINNICRRGKNDRDYTLNVLVALSECDEVGLGVSKTRTGKRISRGTAEKILDFVTMRLEGGMGLRHVEELQLVIDGVSKDRVSDIFCSVAKSFLIDFTIEQSKRFGIPTTHSEIDSVFNHQKLCFDHGTKVDIPVHPDSGKPILFVPKRWLRYSPWIGYDDFFSNYVPNDDAINRVTWDRATILGYNRDNYGYVQGYISLKERTSEDCSADPLFKQIPVLSARRKMVEIRGLSSGKTDNSDQKYEAALCSLISSMMYPHLDFAQDQVRTDSGAQIRDLVFYMNRDIDFLRDIHDEYGTKQLVFEIKNVKSIDRDNLNQLNRYLGGEFGRLGFLVTRNRLSRAMRKNTIDLWSGQRRAIIPLTDEDIALMVDLFEEKKRAPIDVIKRSYIAFRRECPS